MEKMTKGESLKEIICNYFEKVRNENSNITDEMLYDNGKIFYMNGNDGTDFDYHMNGRLCEFFIFYKNEMGFIKVFVEADGEINGYIYFDEGQAPGQKLKSLSIDKEDVLYLKELLEHNADQQSLWDVGIDEIDFKKII